MLGPLRFFLASCVIAAHLTNFISHIGGLAVNCFYVISGYLITLVLKETYNFGFVRFAINRFLRLYPTYYALLILAIWLHLFTTGATGASPFHASWVGELQKGDILANALMVPWSFLSDSVVAVTDTNSLFYSNVVRYRVIPSTWSIGVEMVCYLMLWIFVARNLLFACTIFLISATYHYWIAFSGANPALNYFPVIAAMLPFSIGAMGYYLGQKINIALPSSNLQQIYILIFLICLFCINWYLSLGSSQVFYYSSYYYINNIIAFLAVSMLHKSKPSKKLNYWCKWLGDLAYPMFLSHYLGGYIGWHILGMPSANRGLSIFILGYFISIALSILTVLIIDKQVNKLRDLVRPIHKAITN